MNDNVFTQTIYFTLYFIEMSKQQGNSVVSPHSQQWRICLADFQQEAKTKLQKSVYGYFSSGSDDEITLKRNLKALKNIRLYPRVLKDMGKVTMDCKVLGHKMDIPFGVAPAAMQKLIHPEGQLLAAKQSYKQNTAYGLSMLSTTRPSQILKVNPSGLKIQQLYLLKNAEYTRQFIKMVAENGFHALALTVDTQVFGKRRADKMNKFAPNVPLQVFKQLGVDIQFDSPDRPQKSFIQSINTRVNWQDVKKLKTLASQFNLKLILKGIVQERDAALAIQAGVDAIWISNHGGRQLDTSPATIQVLPAIKKQAIRLKSPIQIYIDGGIVKGSDIFKCLALGADFVFLGRGFLYSLIDGAEGIQRAFQILKSEFKTTMMLSGTRSISEITSEYVIFKEPYSRL